MITVILWVIFIVVILNWAVIFINRVTPKKQKRQPQPRSSPKTRAPVRIRFAAPVFSEAMDALRSREPMPYDQFCELSPEGKRHSFSFKGASSVAAALAVRNVLEGVINGEVAQDNFCDAANKALTPFGIELRPGHAGTISQTVLNQAFNKGNDAASSKVGYNRDRENAILRTELSRSFNDGHDAAFNNPLLVNEYPYVGLVTAADIRVRPNHYVLDYRRCKTVFKRDDPIWIKMSPPLGKACRCWKRYFRRDELESNGLKVGNGEDWYRKTIEIDLPGGRRVQTAACRDGGLRKILIPKLP